ncbi:MAG: tyrosine-type recombinase/integrase [Lachnospiraceae bacterium]|nr:tyrosine-type recombinase/integrase [Lachnospiraceae bacterium]
MQEQNYSFLELRTALLKKLGDRGCTPITITGYRYLCNSIFKWLSNNGFDRYTAEAGNRFLQCYQSEHGENPYYFALRTVVQRLNDISKGSWSDVHSDKGKHFCLPNTFAEIVDRYCSWNESTGHTSGTIKIKRYAISWFLDVLAKQNCKSLNALSPACIAQACIKVTNHGLWGEIRLFLTYLSGYEGVKSDYSTIIPHYSKPHVIPSIYSVEEIKRIEEAIDTSTVLGKRDYAMILLASRMGMRSGDIMRLTIEDVLNKTALDIIQTKTGNILHLPLISEVKSAIDDYLSVRPKSQTNMVFINAYAPYNPITTATMRTALRKYIRLAGIDSGNRKRGPHALRASLASSMVNNDISYETVRKILGHSSNNAIKHYARIDVENLRKYSLTPPPPSDRFFDFLYGEVE